MVAYRRAPHGLAKLPGHTPRRDRLLRQPVHRIGRPAASFQVRRDVLLSSSTSRNRLQPIAKVLCLLGFSRSVLLLSFIDAGRLNRCRMGCATSRLAILTNPHPADQRLQLHDRHHRCSVQPLHASAVRREWQPCMRAFRLSECPRTFTVMCR